MIDTSRFCLGRTDERQTCGELYVGEHLLHILLDTDTVLDEYHQRPRTQQRGQQIA